MVPSRYALKVGAIDVVVVSDGVLSLPGAMLGHNVDPAVRAAWLEDMFLPPDVLEWALNAVVVRSGGRTILIDAGMGVEFPDLPRAGQWAQRLEAAGIDLASVTDVVLTHMHMDHCGGLLANGVKEQLRSDLRVHVAAAEAEFWESPISPASPCRRGSRTRFGGRASGSCKSTTTGIVNLKGVSDRPRSRLLESILRTRQGSRRRCAKRRSLGRASRDDPLRWPSLDRERGRGLRPDREPTETVALAGLI